ncbi:hypothetical protein B0H11DRAFT_2238889 [Mycena galericulata]|nr:hypothetical protein B0H11DRAFT_2238889 [Mycena galericulata]
MSPHKNKKVPSKKAGKSAGSKAKAQITAKAQPASQTPKAREDHGVAPPRTKRSVLQPVNDPTSPPPPKRSVLTDINQREGGRQRKLTLDRLTRESEAISRNPKAKNPKRKAAEAQLEQEAENEAAPPPKKAKGKSRAQPPLRAQVTESPLRPRPKPNQKSEGNFLFQNISQPSLIIAEDAVTDVYEEHREEMAAFRDRYPPAVIFESDSDSEHDEEDRNGGDDQGEHVKDNEGQDFEDDHGEEHPEDLFNNTGDQLFDDEEDQLFHDDKFSNGDVHNNEFSDSDGEGEGEDDRDDDSDGEGEGDNDNDGDSEYELDGEDDRRQQDKRKWRQEEKSAGKGKQEAEDKRKEQEAMEKRQREQERAEEQEAEMRKVEERRERQREREKAKEQEQRQAKEREQRRQAKEQEQQQAKEREQGKRAHGSGGKTSRGRSQGTSTTAQGRKGETGAGGGGRGAEEGKDGAGGSRQSASSKSNTYDVLDHHRSRNRPTRPPNNQDLSRYRQKQQGADGEDEDQDDEEAEDDEDDEDDEGGPGHGRKTRTKTVGPTSQQEGFYPKAWRKVFALTKDRIYIHLLNTDLWPDRERESLFNPKLLTFLQKSIDYAERKLGLDLSAEGDFYPEYQDDMVELLWAFVATFRSKCKGQARDIVQTYFQEEIWPSREQYPDIKRYQQKVASNVKALLEGSSFHKNGKDKSGRTNNFMNPAMGALAFRILFSGKRPLGRSEDFKEYKPNFIMALVTFLRSGIDEFKSGKAGKASFYEAEYGPVYRNGLKKFDDLKRDDYHWKKTSDTWDEWRLDNTYSAGRVDEDGEQSGDDMDIDLD